MKELLHSKVKRTLLTLTCLCFGVYAFTSGWLKSPVQSVCAQENPCVGAKGKDGPEGPSGLGTFQGVTTAKTTGSGGGWKGMKAKCDSQYSGSHVCSEWELMRALQDGSLTTSAQKAWIVGSSYRLPNDAKVSSSCSGWDSADPSDRGAIFLKKSNGNIFIYSNDCDQSNPIACCK
ncbi:MAG: hypothetical protein EP343_28035 [Deltaproteobacteria bacterium]|nr:MAG: hypothetical protein EP343_28035 [Deltaproteobacteria bacterium]